MSFSSEMSNLFRTFFMLSLLVISTDLLADRDFAERQAINLTGDFKLVGNTNMRCTSSCGSNQSNNPPALMNFVNIDPAGGANVNSSSSELILPAGYSVVWAGLYWTGVDERRRGLRPPPASLPRNQVRFRTPSSGYTTVTADQVETNNYSSWSNYMAFKDVTAQVQAAGAGNYFVANIRASTGSAFTGPNASWVLAVIYSAPGETFKRINIWDGWKFFGFGAFENFTVTGLLTPSAGAIEAKVGVWAMDGESSQAGDVSTLNGNALSNGANPSNNFANGTITEFGNNVTSRNPNITPYNWGVDLDVFDATGYLGNGDTTANVRLGSSFEGIWSGLYAISTRLVIPSIDKSFAPNSIVLGDTSRVTVTINNPIEGLSLTGTSLADSLPADMIIAPVPTVNNSCGGTVTAISGTNTLSLANGTVPPGGSCSFSALVTTTASGNFNNVIPKEDLDNDQNVDAQADAQATLTVTPPVADISVTKNDSSDQYTPGTTSSYQIVVRNDGPSSVAGVEVLDELPNGATLNSSWSCSVTTAGIGTVATACDTPVGGAAGDDQVSTSVDLANGGVITITVEVLYSSVATDYL